jgi:hypothetical protein
VIKLAAALEAKEEEEMIKRALEISQRQEDERKRLENEEEEMLRQAIEASKMEEDHRLKKQQTEEELLQ